MYMYVCVCVCVCVFVCSCVCHVLLVYVSHNHLTREHNTYRALIFKRSYREVVSEKVDVAKDLRRLLPKVVSG